MLIGLHVILILKDHWHNNLHHVVGKFAYEIIEWENHVGICAYVLWWSSCLDALLFHFFYIDPNFGLTTKAKAWQWEHVIRRMFQDLSTLPQVWESEPQSAFSCWELESCGALVYVFFNDTRLVLLWRIPPFVHTRLVWIWI